MSAQDDSDWLYPERERPTAVASDAGFSGVWRLDDEDSVPVECKSLWSAIADSPSSPVATIYRKGALLAFASEEEADWRLTPEGHKHLVGERRVVEAVLGMKKAVGQ